MALDHIEFQQLVNCINEVRHAEEPSLRTFKRDVIALIKTFVRPIVVPIRPE